MAHYIGLFYIFYFILMSVWFHMALFGMLILSSAGVQIADISFDVKKVKDEIEISTHGCGCF